MIPMRPSLKRRSMYSTFLKPLLKSMVIISAAFTLFSNSALCDIFYAVLILLCDVTNIILSVVLISFYLTRLFR